jgi:cellulose synthase operon protein B
MNTPAVRSLTMNARNGTIVSASKHRRYLPFLVCLVILVFSLITAGVARADEQSTASSAGSGIASTGTFGVFADHINLQLFNAQQLLNLPTNTKNYYFTIPEGVTLGSSCTLSLTITSSDTLINDLSAISVDVNENRVDTIPINSIGANGNGTWSVNIPVDYLKVGAINSLAITTTQRSIEGDCADIDNPSNWVTLETSSYLDLRIKAYPALRLDTVFSTFYDSILSGSDLSTRFVLPQGGNSSALYSGALTIASAAGAYKPSAATIDFSAVEGSSIGSALHSIFVGWESDWASLFNVDPTQTLTAGQGYLKVAGTTSPTGSSRLLVSGADDTGVLRAAGLVSSVDYLSRLSGDSSVATSDINNATHLETNSNGVYTFENLGYDTLSLAGAFHQTATFSITQPSSTQCGSNSTITINFSHSKALQADKSLLTVKINGVAIDSVQLTDSNAVDGSITVSIPEEARDMTTIPLEVDVYNYIGKVDCSKNYYDVAWTVIKNSSSVYFDPTDLVLNPRLDEFLKFNLWKQTSSSKLIMRSNGLTDSALDLAVRAGQENVTAFGVVSEDLTAPVSELDKSNNIIYVGSESELASLPQEVQSALTVAPQGNGTFSIASNAPFIDETLRSKIIFQVIRSPWDYDKYIYVIAYPDGGEGNLAQILRDGTLLSSLTGTISCVDTDGTISSYDATTNTSGEEAPLSYATLSYKVQKMFGVSLWFLIAGIIVLILLLILFISLIRKRRQFEHMERKMKQMNKEFDEERAAATGIEGLSARSQNEKSPTNALTEGVVPEKSSYHEITSQATDTDRTKPSDGYLDNKSDAVESAESDSSVAFQTQEDALEEEDIVIAAGVLDDDTWGKETSELTQDSERKDLKKKAKKNKKKNSEK